jgi:urease accessory protein UreF
LPATAGSQLIRSAFNADHGTPKPTRWIPYAEYSALMRTGARFFVLIKALRTLARPWPWGECFAPGLALAFVYGARWMGIGRIVTLAMFLTLWLVVCVFDGQRGIREGYAASTELLIRVVLFVVPAAIAVLLARSLQR